ncbi:MULTISPECIES: sensor histidine kinase [unclassified Microbacterium]|uniref:sensor histidine kinase n=1 Tax=unclassified Microbacterium TaxID=2609290 RepID=UPI000C2B7EB4|nr:MULTISPECIES: histidine kinase [unclassified Microbacterium]
MSAQHPPVNPIVVGLQVGLQVLFVALLAFSVVMGLLVPGAPAPAILILAIVMMLTYGVALLGHAIADARRRRALQWAWIAILTVEWIVLMSLTPFAAYLAFPLFFLYLDLLPEPIATASVGLATIGAVVALGMHGEWTVGGVIGPIVGAGVAILIGRAYRALRVESAEHQRLYEELLAAQSRLAAVEREAGMMSERERLAREIHDTVAQSLSSITLLLNAVERMDPDAQTITQVRLARQAATESLSETRRFIRELTPPLLDERSLGGALRRLAETWRRPGLTVEVRAADALDLPMTVQTALLRVAQGAMANVISHADATKATVSLWRDGTSVLLVVVDDGVGFPIDELVPTGGGESFGLRAIRARVEELDGTLDLQSTPGAGTRLSVELPVGTP